MILQIVAKHPTFAWISEHRRCARDYGHLPASHEAMIL